MAKDNEGEPDGDEVETAPAEETIDPTELETTDEDAAPVAPEVPAIPAAPVVDPQITSILGSLAALGIPLPADGSIADFGALDMALKIAIGVKKSAGGSTGDDDGLNYGPNADGTQAGSGPPMMMSQAAMAAKYPDRVENDRKNLKAQIGLLFKQGRINGPIRDAMLREFEGFEMSYAGSRLCVRGLLSAVTQLKKLVPPGTFLGKGKSFDMSQTAIVAPPKDLVGEDRKTREDAAAKALREKIEADNIARGAAKPK